MAFMKRALLHLALYESAYANAPKVVETTVSEVPKVGFKIPIGHVKRVMKIHLQEMELSLHVNTWRQLKTYVVYLVFLVFLMIR